MAATTHDGITYTPGGGDAVEFTADLTLDMYAGTPNDSTAWLNGNSGGSYPGTLAGFNASNSDGSAVAGLKLVCGRLTTAPGTGDTLTVSGDATTVQAVILGNTEVAAAGTKVTFSGDTLTFTVTGTPTAGVTMWLVLA